MPRCPMRRTGLILIALTLPAVAPADDKAVGRTDPKADQPILVLDAGGHTAVVEDVLFTPDGRELITVSDDKTIRAWDVASGEPLRVLRPPIGPGSAGTLYAAALSPDGRTLAVGGYGIEGGRGRIYLVALAD